MSTWAERTAVLALLAGCGSSEPAPHAVAPRPASTPAVEAPPPSPPPPVAVDAGSPADAAAPAPAPPPKVKVENIGMHVGGGPFDEATKEPFKRAVAPHHPAMAICWGRHVTKQKPFDMGVDLLIEAAGGPPKVSNPRVHFDKGDEDGQFVPCIIHVFEGVEFPPLARGKSGVSYSLRFTPTP